MAAGKAGRAVIFRMVGEESASNAALLARTLSCAGFEPRIVPFWPDPDHLARDAYGPVLVRGSFRTARRLSAYALRQLHGFSPDLIELSAHSLAIADARIDNLLTESAWNQQLRGVASEALAVMADLAPDVVFVPHGAEVVSRLLAAASAHLGVPFLYWESPFFPGYHFVDPYAPHFFRGAHRIDRTWKGWAAAHEDGAAARGAAFIARIRAERISKYDQATAGRELEPLKAWLGERPGPVLFVPGQIAFDASITVSLRGYPDLSSIYRAVFQSLPKGWRAIFKPHPRGPGTDRMEGLPEQVCMVRNVSIHDLFPLCDVVGAHSSNVGLEALMAGRPVIAWGEPYYGRKGLTIDIENGADLGCLLADGPPPPPDPERVAALVGHVLEQGLVRQDDAAALRQRVAEATAVPPEPRLPWYGAPIRRLAEVGVALDRELARNQGMGAALRALPQADRWVLQDRFGAWALRRHCRGAPRFGAGGLARRLTVAWRFSRRLGHWVHFEALDLQAVHDPVAALAALATRVRAGARLVLLRRRPSGGKVIQQLTAAEVTAWFAAEAPDLVADVFGWSAKGLSSEVVRDALLLLRPTPAPPLSEADRCALTDRFTVPRRS